MPIEFKKCAVIDGVPYLTLDEAKRAHIQKLFSETFPTLKSIEIPQAVDLIMGKQDQIMNALTLTAKSRPAARKANGAVRKSRITKAAENAALQDMKQ